MALAQVYANLQQAYAASDAYRRKQVINQIFRKHFALAWLRAKGRIRMETEPGTVVQFNVSVGENPSVDWGDPDDKEVWQAADTLRTASLPWATIKGNWMLTEKQLTHNMAPAKVVDLVKLQNDTYIQTFTKKISQALMAGVGPTAAQPTKMNGFANILYDSGSLRPPSYAGLTTAEYDSWQANVSSSNGLSSLVSDLGALWRDCVDETAPDVWITDKTGHRLYEETMSGNIRYHDLEVGDATFEGLDYHGKPMIFDNDLVAQTSVPTGWSGSADTASTHRFMALNLSDWFWVFTPGHTLADIASPPLISLEPDGLRAKGAMSYLECQLVCEKLFDQGLLVNVPES